MSLNILFEDEWILVCEKPIKVPSQSDKSSDFDMVNRVKNHIYEVEDRTNPYVGLIHRLDRPVGGVMVFSKKEEATRELNRQMTSHAFKKRYFAVVTGEVEDTSESVEVRDFLMKDGRTNLSKVVSAATKGAKEAILSYHALEKKEEDGIPLTLLDIELKTGRHHQIRVQLSNRMEGIWGDTKYNKRFTSQRGWTNVALYSYELSFVHPNTKKELTFHCVPRQRPFDLFKDCIKNKVNSSFN